MKDFFISYNGQDQVWAEWIAWTLEEAGYRTVIQAWDFRPGGNFVLEMQKAALGTQRTLAVLSQNYLDAEYTQPEWADALRRDPQGAQRTLLPVRIDGCRPPGLLASVIYVDLNGLAQDAARQKLLDGLAERGKPANAPVFPGAAATPAASAPPGTVAPAAPPANAASAIDWPQLSGTQLAALQAALLATYPQRSALEQMVRFQLDVSLNQIAGNGNLRTVVYEVLEWAVSAGRTAELFAAAQKGNPGNPALQALPAELLRLTARAAPAPTRSGSTHAAASASAPVASASRNVSVGGDVSGSVIIMGDGNVIHLPPGGAPFPGAAGAASPTDNRALAIWREKLEYLRQQEAILSDPAQKFQIKKQIEEAEAKIRESNP